MLAWPAMDAARESAAGSAPPGVAWGLRVAVAALIGWAVFFGGASGSASVPWLGGAATLVAGAALVCIALGLLPLPRLEWAGAVAVGAGVLLLVWVGLTIWWSIAGDRSWEALNKGVVYLAFGALGLAFAGLGRQSARDLAFVLAAVIGAALVWALAGKAIPALGPEEAGRVARLQAPVGYWNALGLLAGAALPLGLWLAAAVRGRAARTAGSLLVYAAALTILLTQSRAGLVAGVAVTALWLALQSRRVEAAVIGLLAAFPGIVVGGWAFTRPALVEDGGARADRVADGALLGALIVAGAVVVVVLALRLPVERMVEKRRRDVLRALASAGALLLVVGAIGLVAAVGNPFDWAVHQVGGKGEVVNDPTRFGSLQTNNRTAWWGEAWRIFRAHPGGGTGAYTFEIARKQYRATGANVAEPHSAPMQLLSDTGLPGLALGLVLAGALALGLWRSISRLAAPDRAAATALVALPAAYALHALVDYDPDFLAVTAPTALVCGFLLGAGRPAVHARGGTLIVGGVVVAAVAMLYSLAAPTLAARKVDAAYRDAEAGSYARAAAAARSAQGLNPLSPEPLQARGTVAQLAGDRAAADAFYVRATRLQPENPATWVELGIFRYAAGNACGAYYAFNAAYTLDPKSTFWSSGGPLDLARAAVNNGACEPQG